MNNLAKRVLTAIALIAVLLVTLYLLPWPAPLLLFAAFMLMGAWEWGGFIAGARPLTRILFMLMLVIIAIAPFLTGKLDSAVTVSMYVAIAYWATVFLILLRSDDQYTSITTAVAGAFALVPAWFALAMLVAEPYGPEFFLWCVGIVAASDIGAYFTGKRYGRTKLAPSISPGKTREGLFGGLAAAALVGGAAGIALNAPILLYAVASALIAMVSVAGDLWVSRFKRAANLKDSGNILPGHGGVMDRVDSLVAALPLFAFLVLHTIGPPA